MASSADDENESKSAESSRIRTPISSMDSSMIVSDMGDGLATRYDEETASSHSMSMTKIVDAKTTQLYAEARQAAAQSDGLESALAKLNRALSLRPQISQYYADRAEIFIQIADFRSAILNLKKAHSLDPKNSTLFERLAFANFFYGQILFDEKYFDDALTYFRIAVRMRPDRVGYHVRCAVALSALGRHGECLDLINKRLRLDRANPDLYVVRARLQEMFSNTTLAYYDVKSALELEGSHAEAISMLRSIESKAVEMKDAAVQQSLSGNSKDALQRLTSAIQTNPSVASYHVLRGTIYRRLGDFESAVDDFLIALDKCGEIGDGDDDDDDVETSRSAQRQLVLTYNDFAVECFTKKYYNEAVVLLNKAIKAEKAEVGLYVNRGDCFYCMRELAFSLADYQQALDLGGDGDVRSRLSVVHGEMGVNEFEAGRYDKASEHFTSAIDNNGLIPRYYVCRAHCRYARDEATGALDDVVAALALQPENDDAVALLQRLCPGQKVDALLRRGRGAEIAAKFRERIESKSGFSNRRSVESEEEGVETVARQLAASISFDLERVESQQVDRTSEETPLDGDKDVVDASVAKRRVVAPSLSRRRVPDLKACMKEREFHAEIYYGKKKMDLMVERVLRKRIVLDYVGPRLAKSPMNAVTSM